MARMLLALLLSLVASLCQANSQKITFTISGNSIGTNVYEAKPDGYFSSVSEFDVVGRHLVSKLDGKIVDGKLVAFTLHQDTPQAAFSEVFDGSKLTQTVGDNLVVKEVKGAFAAVYANNHPQLARTLLMAMKSDVLEDQTISFLLIDTGSVSPLKARFKTAPPVIKDGIKVSVRKVELNLGPVSLQYAFDERGVVVGEYVQAQKVVATLEGYGDVFEDPLSKFPELSQPTQRVKTEKGIAIPMRDGVKLVHDMMRPEAQGKYPVILFRTPYGKANGGIEGEFYARRGYVYISQDCRGRDDSEGQWDPFVNERKDGFDTIDWIAKQPWCDGNVGMIGGSYMGYVQWAAAVEQPPALKCIIPQVSPPDAFTNIPYDNGIPMLWGALWWSNITSGKETHLERAIQGVQNPDALTSLPLSSLDAKVLGYKVPFFQEWLDRDTMAKWNGFNTLKDVAKVKIPTLSISGWWDGDEIGTQLIWQARREAGLKNQWLVYGPWSHAFNTSTSIGDVDYGPDAIIDLDSLYLRWFDTWLKGKSVALEKQSKVRAFVAGENKWHDLGDWPDDEASASSTMYLSSEGPANGLKSVGGFADEVPKEQEPDRYAYNPANVEVPEILKSESLTSQSLAFRTVARADNFLIYRTPAMKRPTTVSGPISLDLFFSTTAKDTDFFAVLVDEDERGAMHFADQPGKVRASFLESHFKRSLLTPGKVYRATIKLWDTAHCFLPGHRMVLVITSSMFPAYARNLNTGEQDKDAVRMVTASQTIYHDRQHPSALHFQVLETKKLPAQAAANSSYVEMREN